MKIKLFASSSMTDIQNEIDVFQNDPRIKIIGTKIHNAASATWLQIVVLVEYEIVS